MVYDYYLNMDGGDVLCPVCKDKWVAGIPTPKDEARMAFYPLEVWPVNENTLRGCNFRNDALSTFLDCDECGTILREGSPEDDEEEPYYDEDGYDEQANEPYTILHERTTYE